MKAIVIIPTYNEAENIRAIIERVLTRGENIDILIIDDNSPDGTGDIVGKITEQNDRVNIIRREAKLGLGSAYITGFRYALENGYDAVIEMDGDFSHNPDDLPAMLETLEDADAVVGSRYVNGVSVVYWPFRRLLLSYLASLYVRVITGMRIKDPTAGFICYSRKALESIDFGRIMSDGYSFQIEMKYRLWVKKFKIKELPIIFIDRVKGHSKMSKKIVYEAVWMVWKLKMKAILKKL